MAMEAVFHVLFVFLLQAAVARAEAEPNRTYDFDPKSCRLPPHENYVPSWDGTSAGPDRSIHLPSFDLPERCGESKEIARRMLVAAGMRAQPEAWLADHLKIPHVLYDVDNPAASHSRRNVGREAMAYFTFIAEHFDCLPEVIVFAHSHRNSSWHRWESLDVLVNNFRWERVKGFGYIQPFHQPRFYHTVYVKDPKLNLVGKELTPPYTSEPRCEEVVNNTLYKWMDRILYDRGQTVGMAWDYFFGPAGFGPLPESLRFLPGGEFVITRSKILARPRQFYLDAISFLLEFSESGQMTSFDLATVFELTWHIIFGEAADHSTVRTKVCELNPCPLLHFTQAALIEQ